MKMNNSCFNGVKGPGKQARERMRKDRELKEAASLVPSGREYEQERKLKFLVSDDPLEQNKLANELLEWADLESSMNLDDFPVMKHISTLKFYKLADKNPYFNECLEYARAAIGSRFEAKARLDPRYVKDVVKCYSTHWRDIEAKRNKVQQEAETTFIIHETNRS